MNDCDGLYGDEPPAELRLSHATNGVIGATVVTPKHIEVTATGVTVGPGSITVEYPDAAAMGYDDTLVLAGLGDGVLTGRVTYTTQCEGPIPDNQSAGPQEFVSYDGTVTRGTNGSVSSLRRPGRAPTLVP